MCGTPEEKIYDMVSSLWYVIPPKRSGWGGGGQINNPPIRRNVNKVLYMVKVVLIKAIAVAEEIGFVRSGHLLLI